MSAAGNVGSSAACNCRFTPHAVLGDANEVRRCAGVGEPASFDVFGDLGIAPRPAGQLFPPIPDEPLARIEVVEKRQVIEELERTIGVAFLGEAGEQDLPRVIALLISAADQSGFSLLMATISACGPDASACGIFRGTGSLGS